MTAREVCPTEVHEAFKASLETWVRNVTNVREQPDVDGYRTLIGECRICKVGTLGYELAPATVVPIGRVCPNCGCTNKPPVPEACRLCGSGLSASTEREIA